MEKREQTNPRTHYGGTIFRALVVISLLAIAAGILLPMLGRKGRTLSDFDDVGAGRIEGSICTNDFLGFSIELPEGWRTATREALRQWLQERNQADQKDMAIVLVACKDHPAAPGELNPALSLLVGAKRLSSGAPMSGLKRTSCSGP